jgi:hypothetical protein
MKLFVAEPSSHLTLHQCAEAVSASLSCLQALCRPALKEARSQQNEGQRANHNRRACKAQRREGSRGRNVHVGELVSDALHVLEDVVVLKVKLRGRNKMPLSQPHLRNVRSTDDDVDLLGESALGSAKGEVVGKTNACRSKLHQIESLHLNGVQLAATVDVQSGRLVRDHDEGSGVQLEHRSRLWIQGTQITPALGAGCVVKKQSC